jgi:hypothetical protein
MDNKPRKLLCTWHVIKNWNIQGKAKIKTRKLEMKTNMKQMSEQRFSMLCQNYFQKLEEADEQDFLNYLKRQTIFHNYCRSQTITYFFGYYFQSEERVQMWAHCFRKNDGINTNMSIESLNNFFKTNQLKRNSKVTIDKMLLTGIGGCENVKLKKTERPDAANYQHRIVMKAHKKAELMKKNFEITIQKIQFREFKV